MKAPHPQITARRPDPEDYVPFFSPGPDYSVFTRRRLRPPLQLESENERLGLSDGKSPRFVNDIDRIRVEQEVGRVIRACGTSRARGKAGVTSFILLYSLSACWVPLPLSALDALEFVLRPGKKWKPAPEDWLGGLAGAETFALQIISHVRENGPDLHSRRAAMDLARWYAFSDWPIPPVIAVNAIGVVLGVVDPYTGLPTPSARQMAMQSRPVTSKGEIAIIAAAKQDGQALALASARDTAKTHLKRIDPQHHDLEERQRWFNKVRERDGYQEVLAASGRAAAQRLREEQDLSNMADAFWLTFNRVSKRALGQRGHGNNVNSDSVKS